METDALEFVNSRVIREFLVQLRIFTFFLVFLRLFTQILVEIMQKLESRLSFLGLKNNKKV